MLTIASDCFSIAIHELLDAANGAPTGMPFSALAEIALVRVILAEGHQPDCQTHLLKAIDWLEAERIRAREASRPVQ